MDNEDHEFWEIKQDLIKKASKSAPSIAKQPSQALSGIFQGVNNLQRFFLAFWSVFDPHVTDKYVAEDPGKSSSDSSKKPISEAPYYDFMEGIFLPALYFPCH